MRLSSLVLAALALASLATGCGGRERIISSDGVRVVVPPGWQRVHVARPGPVSDPRTLLVVGTAGVRPRAFHCELAAYSLPPSGAVVVVVGWKSPASAGGGPWKRGRAPLKSLTAVRQPSFECFAGRGASSDVLLGGRPYGVNVMVGDRASETRVQEALAVARSFDLTR
jgi:hypothetical protein